MKQNLRGAIFSKFQSITSFADAIGWNRKKASDIVNGKRRPSAKEMEQISKLLGIEDAGIFTALFFPSMYALETKQ